MNHKPRKLLSALLPKTLFGRLALLLSVAVLASHALALTLMFQLRPLPPEPELPDFFMFEPAPRPPMPPPGERGGPGGPHPICCSTSPSGWPR